MFKRNQEVFILGDGVQKAKVTKVADTYLRVKVGSKSYSVDTGAVYAEEIPALKTALKYAKQNRAAYKKDLAAAKKAVRMQEQRVRLGDKAVANAEKALAKASQ